MPSIAVDCAGLDPLRSERLAAEVRHSVITALPDTEAACTCRVRTVSAARPGPAAEAAKPFAWIDVALFPGRTLEWKRVLYTALVAGCVEAGIDKAAVSITLREPGLDDWGIRGGVPAADVFAPSRGRPGP